MRPPSLKTRLVGHPLTVFLAGGYALLTLYLLYASTQLWPLIFPAAFLMNKVMQAHEQVIAYDRWKVAWDAMGGGTNRRPKRIIKKLIGIFLGLGLVGSFMAIADGHGNEAAIGVFMIVGIAACGLAIMIKLWRWLRRRRRKAAKTTPVTVCVVKPLLPAPGLQHAYNALPDYARQLMGGQS